MSEPTQQRDGKLYVGDMISQSLECAIASFMAIWELTTTSCGAP